MMSLVVYGHLLEPAVVAQQSHLALTLYLLIYLFHVPAWAFLAGITSKVETSIESSIRLFGVFAVFQVIYVCITGTFHNRFSEWIFTPWWVLWFLVSLISWKLLLPIALKFRWSLIVSVVIALAVGAGEHIGRPFSLSRTFVWFPLFLAGNLYGKSILSHAKEATAITKAIACASFLIAAVALWVRPFGFQSLYEGGSYSSAGFHSIGMGIAFRSGHFLLACILEFASLCLVPKGKNVLTKYGTRTLSILVIHPFLVRLVQHAGPRMSYPGSSIVCALCAAGIIWLSSTQPVHEYVSGIYRFPQRLFPAAQEG